MRGGEYLAKQKRSFFQKIFGNKPKNNQILTTAQMLNSYSSRIYNYSGSLYDNAVVRAAIDCNARYTAKLGMRHALNGVTVHDNLNNLLSLRPNPYQSTYSFLYQLRTIYDLDNNAYVFIQRDDFGNPIAFWPFSYSQAELKEDKAGNNYLEFTFRTGKKVTAPIEDVIILRKHQYENDFFGESNRRPLFPLVNLLHTISEGIINVCKNSAFLRGILKFTGAIQPDDVKRKRDEFNSEFLSAQNNGGVVAIGSGDDYVPIESKPQLIDEKNTSLTNRAIYDYFGTNENIINGTYSENQWLAYYESTIETFMIQCSEEFNAKVFNQRQISFGNSIEFVPDKLSYMSMTSKVNMIKAVKDLGVLTKGTIADILNVERPSDPDTVLQSLNYVSSEIANEYQLAQAKKGTLKGGDTTDDAEGNPDESDPDQSSGTD
ncbi:MAG TPA: hypothetical protein DC024_10340 [Clostridiales bacterium]|jgi:HK97 family phage portal protein|nr:hypothetical protein [Clostridiales bacterium]